MSPDEVRRSVLIEGASNKALLEALGVRVNVIVPEPTDEYGKLIVRELEKNRGVNLHNLQGAVVVRGDIHYFPGEVKQTI